MKYLSDQELFALMERSEAEGLLTAPQDTKCNILVQTQAPPAKRPTRQKQFYSYCLRVGLATAACLAVLFIPTPEKAAVPEGPTLTVSQHLNRFADTLEQGLLELNRIGNDFDFNFGGNRDE